MEPTRYRYGVRERQAMARELADERRLDRARLHSAIDALLEAQADTVNPDLLAAIDDALARLQMELERWPT